MRGYGFSSHFLPGDSTRDFGANSASHNVVSRSYFETTGLKFLQGRTFSGDEETSAPDEIVINRRMAEVYWPGQDPIGQCLLLGSASAPCHRVVGVVDQAQRITLIEDASPQYYVPLGSRGAEGRNGRQIIVRVAQNSHAPVINSLRRLLKDEYPLGYPYINSMTETLDLMYRSWRTGARLFAAFGLLALIVAIVCIYSAVSYSVGRRQREFGIRMALGARVRDVLNQVVAEGLSAVAIGLGVGVGVALVVGPLLASMLFGVAPRDGSALLLAGCSMLLVAGLASLLPAWRASRVDPAIALRAD
jgi:hypothetical protein